MDKSGLVAGFRALLSARLDGLVSEAAAARSGTRVDGSHRPANRGERAAVTTQGYLAHALGRRIEALRTELEQLDEVPPGPRVVVGPGALVRFEEEGVPRTVLVLPGGAGDRVEGVVVISPRSPLARALRGAATGDVVELEEEERALEILAVG